MTSSELAAAATPRVHDPLDALIVGAGPTGLAVANTFAQEGLSYVVVEKGAIAEYIRQFPYFLRFFSSLDLLEIDRFPLTITDEKPSRRQYLAYLSRFVRDRQLNVRTFTAVEKVARDRNGQASGVSRPPRPGSSHGTFRVTVRPSNGWQEVIQARSVVMACGAFGNPRNLGVPGEDLPKVSHRYTEAHPYCGTKVLVVGGRNSAAEVALELWRAGADVSLSYRRRAFVARSIKYWLLPDLENRLQKGEIHGYLGTTVQRIDESTVTLAELDQDEGVAEPIVIENDFVLCLLGYDPPVTFLRSMGIELEPDSNIPRHDPETLETNVPGLFVAGTIVAGNVSGNLFIENTRHHGEMIARRLHELLK